MSVKEELIAAAPDMADEITEVIKSIDGGCVSEVEFLGRGGERIGYWAYGHYDPNYPYQGGELK